MTVIACTINNKFPILLGDVLITAPVVRSKQIPTIALNIDNYLEPSDRKVEGLAQKIYIIKENLCVALAGNVEEMKFLLKEMKIHFSYWEPEDIKPSHIDLFLNEFNLKNNYSSSSFLILFMEHVNEEVMTAHFIPFPLNSWLPSNSKIFDAVLASGSGAEEFINQINAEVSFTLNTQRDERSGILAAHALIIVRLLAIERVSLLTIIKHWGGGFELIFYNGITFSKYSKFGYVVCEGFFDASGDMGIPKPKLVMYYKYQKGFLYIVSIEIRSLTLTIIDEKIIFNSSNYEANMFLVPGIDMHPLTDSFDKPLDYSFTCNSVAYAYTLYQEGIYAPSFCSEASTPLITFNDNKNIEIVIFISDNERIRNGGKEVFKTFS